MGVTIRDYKPTDRLIIEKYITDFQNEDRKSVPFVISGEEIASDYLDFLISKTENGNGRLLVCESDSAVGYGCYYQQPPYHLPDSLEVYVSDAYLVPSYRGKGLGSRIFAMAEEFAKERNIPYMSLKVLAFKNEARRLYSRLGYKEFEIMMYKDLKT
jgi:GNAT superfamily N-acetyltransferase